MRVKAKIKPVIKPDFQYQCPHCGELIGGSSLMPAYHFRIDCSPVETDCDVICPNCWVGADIKIWCENRIWEKR